MPRRIENVKYSTRFLKRLSSLPANVTKKAKEREVIFQADAFNPSLRTHKLHGKDEEAWAFWIDYTYRIKFIFLGEGAVLFLDVGTHDVYR